MLAVGHVIEHTDDTGRILVDKVLGLENWDNVIVHADDTDILVLLINKLPTTPNQSVYLKLDKLDRTKIWHHWLLLFHHPK